MTQDESTLPKSKHVLNEIITLAATYEVVSILSEEVIKPVASFRYTKEI